jgi:multiple sugar transport system substrate-binding protein
VFRFHNSWVRSLQSDLDAVPSYVYSNSDYRKTFFPVNLSQLELEGDIYGIPLSHDGLALVYNKQLFKDMNVEYPELGITWTEFKNLAKKMTKKKGRNIVQSGAALGLSNNVSNFSDILGTLLFQVGADLNKVDEKYYPQVFNFYTSFYNDSKNRIWDESFEGSVTAFTENKVAMIFIPSWRIHEIIYRNPSLEFGLAPVPIFAKNDENIEADAKSNAVWASVWSEGVNSNVEPEKKEAAWKLLKFLSSNEVQLKFSNMIKEKGYRSFGPIFSRQDLAKVDDDEINFAYLNNAMQAKSWYLNSETHDGEINDQMISYFASAIDNLNKSDRDDTNVYTTLQSGINAVLEKYEIVETEE